MQKPAEWTPKQLAVLGYVYRFGHEELGYTLDQILMLMGISKGQWTARWQIDLPAQEGRSRAGTCDTQLSPVPFNMRSVITHVVPNDVDGGVSIEAYDSQAASPNVARPVPGRLW